MALGIVLAFFYEPTLLTWRAVPGIMLALAAACIVASSNYVLNEILDAATDRLHPRKRFRPVPSGRVHLPFAYAEWLLLGAAGLGLASAVRTEFLLSALALWVMGVVYNVPPLRSKEVPYIDVLSESANIAIRLLLGWFALVGGRIPPVSLVLSYWMLGAFFMGTKRLAEFRTLKDPQVAAAYRRSFSHYTENRLLVSILFYVATSSLFAGIFIVRYHLELILFVPVAGGLFAYYMKLGLEQDSPVQSPEKLYRDRGFFTYLVCSFVVFVLLMFTRLPAMYDWFNVEPSRADPLWTIGER